MAFTAKSYSHNQPQYLPKKPVKSFQDLEVYQKALEASVFVAKTLAGAVEAKGNETAKDGGTKETAGKSQEQCRQRDVRERDDLIFRNMLPCALGLPHLIAAAHSVRFGAGSECLSTLEKVMLNCNKMVVYLEQTRDICQPDIAWEQFDELIKKYLYIRRKTLNLQRSWKKYIILNKAEDSAN